MTKLFEKEYSGESLVDLHRDISEMFSNASFTKVPSDEHGFPSGTFVVQVLWVPELTHVEPEKPSSVWVVNGKEHRIYDSDDLQ